MFTVVRSFGSCVLCTIALLAAPIVAAAKEAPAVLNMPDTMLLSPEIRSSVQQMYQNSATFRAQFQRVIEAPSVILTARLDPSIADRSFKARSKIRRYDSGLLVVTMDIGPGAHQAEWIAHEFEHIVEQLEGLDLTAMAAQHAPGVWYSTTEMVETRRAMRAGQAVMEEMRSHPRSYNLVQ